MDISIEKAADITLGSLFQQIINDMKVRLDLHEKFFFTAILMRAREKERKIFRGRSTK